MKSISIRKVIYLANSSTDIVFGNDLSKNSSILADMIAAYCFGSLILTLRNYNNHY